MDYHGLSEVVPPLSADVRDMLELLCELESNATKWYATTDISSVFLNPFGSRLETPVCFCLEGHPVHLESTASGGASAALPFVMD